MTYFRVLCTGSRTWTDYDAVTRALDAVEFGARAGHYSGLTVVHGAAPGADMLADRWVRWRRSQGWAVAVERHPADWSGRGKAAGPERNLAMVKRGADVCVAFIAPCKSSRCRRPKPHDSHGTEKCAAMAERYGIHVVPIRPPDGER